MSKACLVCGREPHTTTNTFCSYHYSLWMDTFFEFNGSIYKFIDFHKLPSPTNIKDKEGYLIDGVF